jgi:membrane-associated phospholipid phosphatase
MDTENPPSPHIFHNIGWNLLNSFTYNYGLNFIGAGVGTWAMIETGLDWKWRNTIFDNPNIPDIGSVVMSTGGVVPIITPVAFYLSGKLLNYEKPIIAASALTQTLILTMAIQTPLKMITGRRVPGLGHDFDESISGEADFSGEFNWFNMDYFNGWPSGHTANAFSAAAALSEIYYDNIWVKIAAYTYASFVGFGVTFHAHWVSEAVAGALIGYAIGKTVGKSYRKFLDNDERDNKISFFCTPYSVGLLIRL